MSQANTSVMRHRIGLITGIVIAVGLQLLPVPEGLDRSAWLLASLALMMAAWWASEAIPIAATALVPLALFVAVMSTMNRLTGDSETVIASAAGMSRFGLIAPILRLAVYVMIANLVINLFVQPIAKCAAACMRCAPMWPPAW